MEIALDSQAIITPEEFQIYTGDDESGILDNKERLNFLINSATGLIRQETHGRLFVTPTAAITEFFSGDGDQEYLTEQAPIVDSGNLELWRRIATTWTQITTTTQPFEIDATAGRILFIGGHSFVEGRRNWKVVYKFGTARESIPHEIKLFCLKIVDRLYKAADGREGMGSQSFGDSNTSWNLETILTDDALRKLRSYRRKNLLC